MRHNVVYRKEKGSWIRKTEVIRHYADVIMIAMVSQITSLTIVYSAVYSGRSKETSRLCVTGPCEGNSPVTGEFPAQRASNAEKSFHLMTSSWIRKTEVRRYVGYVMWYWHTANIKLRELNFCTQSMWFLFYFSTLHPFLEDIKWAVLQWQWYLSMA